MKPQFKWFVLIHHIIYTFQSISYKKSIKKTLDLSYGVAVLPGPSLVTYNKTCFKRPLKEDKNVFKTHNRLMQVRSIAECSTPVEHSVLLLTCTKLPHGFKTFVFAA